MKKKVFSVGSIFGCSLLFLVVLAFRPNHFSEEIPIVDAWPSDEQALCYMENKTFQTGEEMTYKLYYNWNFIWLSAGEVVFKVEDDGSHYKLIATGRTYPAYDLFFKARDYYEAKIDKESLLPVESMRDVHEGKYTVYDKITYDQKNRKAISLRGKTKEKAVRREYEMDGCMHDILSIIYYVRNIEFEEYEAGTRFPLKIFMDKEIWPLGLEYKGKEANVKVKGEGRFNTLKFGPEVIAGTVFKEGTDMNVWASDDDNRIPLLISSPLKVGSVKAVLKDYEGLKHPLTSKIK